MNKELLDLTNEKIANLLDRADRAEDGSDEQRRMYECAVNMMKQVNEDYKFKEEALDRTVRTQNEKEKTDEELKIKEFQAEEEVKARKRISPNTWATLAGGVIIVGTDRLIEWKGGLVPRYVSKVYSMFKFKD